MKLRVILFSLLIALSIGSITNALEESSPSQDDLTISKAIEPARSSPVNHRAMAVKYRIMPDQSQFMVNAYSGGLLWFMGHTHHFAIRNFNGEAEATIETLEPGSLQLTVKADSLEETGKNFTEEQKKIINAGARKEVLEVATYPEIAFKSTDLKSEKIAENQFKAEIFGNLTLHGVTRRIVIPARVTISGDTLRASGEFSINRSDYGVKTHAVKGGLIRVRDKVKFSFDILANKQ